MRSIDELRGLIDNHEKYTDKELREIEFQLEQLANLAFDVWLAEKGGVQKMSD